MILNISDRRYADATPEESYTNVLLRILANNTCDVYVEQIQMLKDVNSLAAQQLAADIGKWCFYVSDFDYIKNVLLLTLDQIKIYNFLHVAYKIIFLVINNSKDSNVLV